MIKERRENIEKQKIVFGNLMKMHEVLITIFKEVPELTNLSIGKSPNGSFACFTLCKVMLESLKAIELLLENKHIVQTHMINRSYLEQTCLLIVLMEDIPRAEGFTNDLLAKKPIKHRDLIKQATRIFRGISQMDNPDWFTQKVMERYKDANKYIHVTEEQILLTLGAPDGIGSKNYPIGENEQLDYFITRIYSGTLLFGIFFWFHLWEKLTDADSKDETMIGFRNKVQHFLQQVKSIQLI